ncbi:MAG: DUF87 domain-containing protein [Blautia sp.]|nr:DUF87 domain-containing protein [Blautia sp.]MDY5031743.1 DUF87 domain-containing protein [Blautia sp.]
MEQQKRYSQYEVSWNKSKQRVSSEQQLAQAFHMADVYLNHTYLNNFSDAPVISAGRGIMDITRIRLIEITKLVFDKKEKFTDKMMSVYSALHNLNSSVALIIDSDEVNMRFYLGVRAENNTAIAGDVLESTLKGNFPGIRFDSLNMDQIQGRIDSIRGNEIKSLAAVSVVPSVRKKNFEMEEYVQGIEKFIDTMNGKKYTMVCLAAPLDSQTAQKRKHGYEELCSALSPHARLSAAYGQNENLAVSESLSASFSRSVNRSVSNANTTSTSSSSGSNSGRNSSTSWNMSGSENGSTLGWGISDGYSDGTFESYTSGSSFTQSISDSEGSSSTEGRSRGETRTTGSSKTITLNFENQGVSNLIERAKSQLERFKICESFGMWEFCSYFMSKDIHTTALAGNAYKALMTGDESNVESAHMNIWTLSQRESINRIVDYVLHLVHPQAEMPPLGDGYARQLVTPANMVSGHELPLVMGLPKKSVSGLAVVEMAEFGRSVVYEDRIPSRMIAFGNIYHMGTVEEARVNMNLDLLASHCFITGSSGSGKSYATYQLLEAVMQNDVKVMIIEPAKGEYKQIFGGVKGIKIFTTDPNAYRILRVNPFQFPENIHLLSHIEQLLQIFNASWSLYAAMPAILKQAVVDAYVKCGWDVQNSIWIPGISDHKYPVFADVLEILPGIINASDYSADSKGDYKGALLTRVQSMTVGMNGMIFKNSTGIEDSLLFDSNVIVDLSELGSEEAIALIMGVLIMKLNEYRKAQRKTNPNLSLNSCLRHVTVLEEAHNLLKRTSKEQSQDSSNIVGQSVEMISNSIKEMRTYGEGFVIIDQSPMAVDASAIENTATKIIMNTPAKDACEELGSALSLTEEQTGELSRLNVGVAAVFQKGWLSPVLMKIDEWDNRYHAEVETTDPSTLRVLKGELVCILLEQYQEGRFSPMKLRSLIRASGIPADKKREIDEIIMSYNEKLFAAQEPCRRHFSALLMELIGCEYLFCVVPVTGIPTYREFLSYDTGSPEAWKAKRNFQDSVGEWFVQVHRALSYYVYIASDEVMTMVLLNLIYAAGAEGKIRLNPENRLAMVCRELYRMFQLPLA